MGQLTEQTIRSIFNGVSRQPQSVRLPSQVQEADNAMMSVVTSGFEKRPATTHFATLTGVPTNIDFNIHAIDRDENERYTVLVGGDTLRVFSANTGDSKTVTVDADAAAYLVGSPSDFRLISVVDYTFILNTKKTVAMGASDGGSVSGTVQNFNKLPTTGVGTGAVYHVLGDEANKFDDYYVKWTGAAWTQTVNPSGVNAFDNATMPHVMVRQSDGTFKVSRATWTPRKVGDAQSVVEPLFVGRTISDIMYYRGRLGFASDEGLTFTQAGDVFNFWPDKATDVLDSDPIEIIASTNKVTVLRHSVPFRKSLFVTSDSVQFEVDASDKLTPKTAMITPTTAYQIDVGCKPVPMGDQLYFAAKSQGSAVVFEYYYDGDSFSNTAADVTKHCLGYIPGGIKMMVASTETQRLFLVPTVGRNHLYVYTSYWSGKEKAQSAWCKYVFGADETEATILGASVLSDYVYLVIRRYGQVVVEKLPVDTEPSDANLGFTPLLDRRVTLTGTYDPVTDKTTWTLPYNHGNSLELVKGSGFDVAIGRMLTLSYPTSTTATAPGNHSAAYCYIGKPYTMNVELSRQYVRGQQNEIVFTGRCQMRRITFQFKRTGYFEVFVTPELRPTQVWKYTGRLIGSILNRVGRPSIEETGEFTAKVSTRSDTATIRIVNDSPLPSTITGASWEGFYNNIAKQG